MGIVKGRELTLRSCDAELKLIVCLGWIDQKSWYSAIPGA